MAGKLLMIILDALDADRMEKYSSEGYLPTLSRLMGNGNYRRLRSLDYSLPECVQVSFYTGNTPDQHGFPGPQRFSPSDYQVRINLESGFDRLPPFFDLGDDLKVLTFDLPSVPVFKKNNMAQIAGWGCHGFEVDGQSYPVDAWQDLLDHVGLHPEHGLDFALMSSVASCRELYQRSIDGLRMRSEATKYLLDRHDWDLAIMSTSETHTGVHYLLPHPGNAAFHRSLEGEDVMLRIYQEADQLVHDLVGHVGDDVDVLVTSMEGMSVNHAEVPNIAYLPEMMLRYSFPGRSGFEYDKPPLVFPEGTPEETTCNWVVNAYHYARRPDKFQERLRKWLPEHVATKVELAAGKMPASFQPESRPSMNYQPSVWFEPYWPHMRAFALPTFSDGYIRLNVKGREKCGKVEPDRFADEMDQICRFLNEFVCESTGVSGIDRIERVRDRPDENSEASPADLLVFWKDHPLDKLVSADYGEVGPLPPLRAGIHNSNAFVMGTGPNMPASTFKEEGHIFDLSATVSHLLGKGAFPTGKGENLLD